MRCGSRIVIPSTTTEVKIMVENDRGKNGFSIQNMMFREIGKGTVLAKCQSFFNTIETRIPDLFINNRYISKKRR